MSICSFVDSCESDYDRYRVSNLAHIDADFQADQNATYVLTARLLEADSAAFVIGGLTFFGTLY